MLMNAEICEKHVGTLCSSFRTTGAKLRLVKKKHWTFEKPPQHQPYDKDRGGEQRRLECITQNILLPNLRLRIKRRKTFYIHEGLGIWRRDVTDQEEQTVEIH